MENKNETNDFMKFLNSSLGRFLLIGVITVLLLLPLSEVSSLIHERKYRAEEIKTEMRSEWGSNFDYSGIVLRIPLKNKKKPTYLFYFPETENSKFQVQVDTKKRGIYHFPVFQCATNTDSKFTPLLTDTSLDLAHAQIGLLANPGTRISDIGKLKVNGKEHEIKEETFAKSNLKTLFYATTPFAIDQTTTKISVNLNYVINGSGKIVLQSNAKKSTFQMTSNWENPSFEGNSLPNPNSLKLKNGFSSSWNILNIAQNPQKGLDNPYHYGTNTIASIDFLESVDQYQLNERSVKYAILVILLTFTVFYLIELIGKMVIHPVHYFMIGLSLILFYVLLLSFSEQIGFSWSYLIASFGITALLCWYAYSVLRSVKFSSTIFIAISLLYSFLYVIVNLETYALMVGSLGLFIVLAAIMSFTRRLKV